MRAMMKFAIEKVCDLINKYHYAIIRDCSAYAKILSMGSSITLIKIHGEKK